MDPSTLAWINAGSTVLRSLGGGTAPSSANATLANAGWTVSTGGGSASGGLSWQTGLALLAGAAAVVLIWKKKG